MKNIYKIKAEKYPWHKEIITVFNELNLDYVVIGATARDFLINEVYKAELNFRATKDFDFAVMLRTWGEFSWLRKTLIESYNFVENRHQIHGLYYKNIPLDIIPFGDISENSHIFWPPDFSVKLNVLGFEDAYRSAYKCEIGEEEFLIASLEGFVILKIVSWSDRKLISSKDAEDIGLILYNYNSFLPEELFQNYSHLIDEKFDYIEVGIKIIGSKMKKILIENINLLSDIQHILKEELEKKDYSTFIDRTSTVESYQQKKKYLKILLETIS